jgi:hypothetical protein
MLLDGQGRAMSGACGLGVDIRHLLEVRRGHAGTVSKVPVTGISTRAVVGAVDPALDQFGLRTA